MANASFTPLRIHGVKCVGKCTVKTCFPCAGKLGMNSIFYLCEVIYEMFHILNYGFKIK